MGQLFICASSPVGLLAFLPCPAGTREGECCHLHTVSLAWVQRVEILPTATGENLPTSGFDQGATPAQEVSRAIHLCVLIQGPGTLFFALLWLLDH